MKQSGAEELLHATEGLVRQCGGLMRLQTRNGNDYDKDDDKHYYYFSIHMSARLEQTAFSLCIVTNTLSQIKQPVK